jgi:adenylate cyclase
MSRSPAAVAFTDLVGFTEYTAERGDEDAVSVLDAQARIVEAALPERARVVKELGDGLMLWFADPAGAMGACLELRRRFASAALDAAPLGVRIGLHWGAPTRRGDDYVGHDVNVAARIVSLAGPGELLVSQAARDACGGLAAVTFEELGPIVMKGIPEPVRLFRVV